MGGLEKWTSLKLAASIWTDGEPIRHSTEHYTGLLTLSFLETTLLGFETLSHRGDITTQWTPGDIAALISLLQYRPRLNPSDNLFQAVSRLSLANDSDQIIERMACMLSNAKTYSAFTLEDVHGAKLRNIDFFCVRSRTLAETARLSSTDCQGVSIRWKIISFYSSISSGATHG